VNHPVHDLTNSELVCQSFVHLPAEDTKHSRFSIKTFIWFRNVDGAVEHGILEHVAFLSPFTK